MIIKKDYEVVKAKRERKSLALKAKKESSDEESSLSEVKTKSTPWRLETSRRSSREDVECPKPPRDENQKAFVEGYGSDSGEKDDEKAKDETCLMAHTSNEDNSTAFCLIRRCIFLLRFGSAIWFCVLLIEDASCVLPREDFAYFKTWLRFVSRLGCVLSQRLHAFVSRPPTFCLKTWLRFVSRPLAFCLKTCCVLSQDLVAFCLNPWLRFISRPHAFCLKTYCVLSQDLLRFVSRLFAFYCVLSINEGPFQMGTVREPLAEGTEGAPHLGPEHPRVYSDLSPEEKDRETSHDYYVRFAKLINDMRNIKMTMSRMQLNSKFVNNILPEWGRFVTAVKLNRGLRDSNYDQLYAYLKQHETYSKENKMMLDRFSQHRVDPLALMSNVSHQQHYSPSSSNSPSTYVSLHLADNAHLHSSLSPTDNLIENLTNMLALLTQSYKTFLPQTNNQLRTSSNTRNQATVQDGRVVAQENGVALDAEQLLFLAGGQNNAIDDDVDEQPAPMAQTMFMANLSFADPVTDEARPSYDSDILSEVQDHDHYQDAICAHQEEYAIHDNVQVNYVVNSHADYTSDSNMIPYDQYVKDNAVPLVHNNVSFVSNDAYMMIYNDMFEPHAQSVFNPSRNTVVENSLTAELATYKEQVKLYERRAKFELTERE
nr:hypothetical protein [Tanacetum cinerariifolium]